MEDKDIIEQSFLPDFTPDQLSQMGVYEEVYDRTKPRLASLNNWPQHWFHPEDKMGWLEWYKKYSAGRRMEDDKRQIKRWIAFKARHGGKMFQSNPTPRRAYALRNWAIDPAKLVKDPEQLKLIMDEYKTKKYNQKMHKLSFLPKLASKEKPGLWANIRAKRKRGEPPATPGDKDFPDKEQWNKLTKKEATTFLPKTAKSPAWQRSEGKNSEGGLNAKGRASYNKQTGGNLKAPVTEKNPSGKREKRQNSFCSRMCGMKRSRTSAETKNDPDSRINKALRKWRCRCG
jgi:hypothetical protein